MDFRNADREIAEARQAAQQYSPEATVEGLHTRRAYQVGYLEGSVRAICEERDAALIDRARAAIAKATGDAQ